MEAVKITNLSKYYGKNRGIVDLDLTVPKGEFFGFIGPNGAGKSTTMNMITGYIASTEGKVMIDGHDILEEPEAAKKCIGYLPKCRQNYTVGIKVPWTLASEANWDATHRMAGKLWVAGGVLILLLAIQPWIPAFPISMVLILAVTFIPMIYSFVYYLRNEK